MAGTVPQDTSDRSKRCPLRPFRAPKRARTDSWGSYARLGNVSRASEATGIHRATHYAWLKDDVAGYRARFEDTQQQWRECLETLVFERLENPRATEAEEGQATLYGLSFTKRPHGAVRGRERRHSMALL